MIDYPLNTFCIYLTPRQGVAQRMYCSAQSVDVGLGCTTYVPQKQFWLIAVLGQYSKVSHVFCWSALFSNTVNTLVENEDS